MLKCETANLSASRPARRFVASEAAMTKAAAPAGAAAKHDHGGKGGGCGCGGGAAKSGYFANLTPTQTLMLGVLVGAIVVVIVKQ